MSSRTRRKGLWRTLAALAAGSAAAIALSLFLNFDAGRSLERLLHPKRPEAVQGGRAFPKPPGLDELLDARPREPERGYDRPVPGGPALARDGNAGGGESGSSGAEASGQEEGWRDALNSGVPSGLVLTGEMPSKEPDLSFGGHHDALRADGKGLEYDLSEETSESLDEEGGRPTGRTRTSPKQASARQGGGNRRGSRNSGQAPASRAPSKDAEGGVSVPSEQEEDEGLLEWEEASAAGQSARSLVKGFRSAHKKRESGRGLGAQKPPKLRAWLGKALKPPEGELRAPSFDPLKNEVPGRMPDGEPVKKETPLPPVVEGVRPPSEAPEYERWKKESARQEPHWHKSADETLYYHKGRQWGSAREGGWVWLVPFYRRWWTEADGAQGLVRHQEHWWWKTRDGWFMLHGGEPWSYRRFPDWRREGFWNPGSGVKMVYSEDAARVALIAPGGAWVVYDAADGKELARGEQRWGR